MNESELLNQRSEILRRLAAGEIDQPTCERLLAELDQRASGAVQAQSVDSFDRNPTLGSSLVPEEDVESLAPHDTSRDSAGDPGEPDAGGYLPAEPLEIRFEIQERLGEGGMGEVFRALDRRLQRSVAVKRLLSEAVGRKRAGKRFLIEAQAVAGLNHPNIVQVYDFGHDQNGPYLVMELVEGESLKERLKRSGAMTPDSAISLIAPICDALAFAHGRGVIHRDVKPANVLLTTEGIPKLADFGLARLQSTDHGQTRAGAVLGTLDFMAPEQRTDARTADARSDLWSLAATLYQLVIGKPPQVIRAERIPELLRDVLLRALEEEPRARYQNVRQFRQALESARQAYRRSEEAQLHQVLEDLNRSQQSELKGCLKELELAQHRQTTDSLDELKRLQQGELQSTIATLEQLQSSEGRS